MVIAILVVAVISALFSTVALLGVVALYDQSDSHMSHYNRRLNMFADRLASHSSRIARNAGDTTGLNNRLVAVDRKNSNYDRLFAIVEDDISNITSNVNKNFREAQEAINKIGAKVFPPKKLTKRQRAQIRRQERAQAKAQLKAQKLGGAYQKAHPVAA
jgi:hypothetical protein